MGFIASFGEELTKMAAPHLPEGLVQRLGNRMPQVARMLAVGGLEDSIRLWEVVSGQVRREFRGHRAKVSCLAFSGDGRLLASGSNDTTLLRRAVQIRRGNSKRRLFSVPIVGIVVVGPRRLP